MSDLITPDPGAGTALRGALLRLEGPDALAVLHRTSTQSLTDLPAGGARMTLFCDFRGRLLHRVCVARTADRTVWVLRDDAPADELLAFMDRLIFREDLRVRDASADHHVVLVPGGLGLRPESLQETDSLPRRVQPEDGFGYELLDGEPASAPDFEVEPARIRAGLPRHAHEVAQAFTPFEIGRAHETHLDKGCFTGQEALMRLVTFKSVRRRFYRVTGTGAPPRVPEPVACEGAAAGILTSAIEDAMRTGWIGLAVLRLDWAGKSLTLADGRPIAAEPVPPSRPRGLPEGMG